jgi:hypothetical protein
MRDETPEVCSSTEIADALASVERLNGSSLRLFRREFNRICKEKGIRDEDTKPRLTKLGSVRLGATFVYRTVEVLGNEYAHTPKPSFEGMVLKVVDFRPPYVNQIVVEEPNGDQSLMPLWMVEKALRLKLTQREPEHIGNHIGHPHNEIE